MRDGMDTHVFSVIRSHAGGGCGFHAVGHGGTSVGVSCMDGGDKQIDSPFGLALGLRAYERTTTGPVIDCDLVRFESFQRNQSPVAMANGIRTVLDASLLRTI